MNDVGLHQARGVMAATETATVFDTDVPARLDRLPWGAFHTLVVIALGVTWIFDGLEVTLPVSVAAALRESPVLKLSTAIAASARRAYGTGPVLGPLLS